MEAYIRRVQYHETDKMGVTHHSNYIKWMEEARIDFLSKLGFSYSKLEKEGIISPIISVECQYKSPTVFDDEVCVNVSVADYRGFRLTVEYIMTDRNTGVVVLTGRTGHCFVNQNGRPIILKKYFPELDRVLNEQLIKRRHINE